MEEASEQYIAFMVGSLGFFECDHMPFRLCNMPATFQQLIQNCLSELNLIYCLIYLDDIIVFSQTVKEHLHQLHIVFDQFREYNLKVKPSKCSLFKEEINYLVHWVSKEGVWPSNLNLKAITECAPPQTYMEVCDFHGLVGHYWWFIKGFACITQPLNEHLTGEGASRKSEFGVSIRGCLRSFWCSKAGVYEHPHSSLHWLYEGISTRDQCIQGGAGAVLSQMQVDGQYHPVAYGSRALMAHEKTTIPPSRSS